MNPLLSPLVGLRRAEDAMECRLAADPPRVRSCRVCGCTDDDCLVCILWTGIPCSWIEADLCSSCAPGAVVFSAELVDREFGLAPDAPLSDDEIDDLVELIFRKGGAA